MRQGEVVATGYRSLLPEGHPLLSVHLTKLVRLLGAAGIEQPGGEECARDRQRQWMREAAASVRISHGTQSPLYRDVMEHVEAAAAGLSLNSS